MDDIKLQESKICNKCGRKLPLNRFRLVYGQFHNPYYLSQCKDCEYKYQRNYLEEKNAITFSDDIEILCERKYKEILPQRILDIEKLNIVPIGTDEMFVNLPDYRDAWISNYGRIIRKSYNKYSLLQGRTDKWGVLSYSLSKNVFKGGKWKFEHTTLYAPRAVVDEFIVNPDCQNNVYVWHSGFDKQDNYYRNLYPLNQEQYRIVKNHFNKTGDDSEDFIVKVMNDIRFKPDVWSIHCMIPIVAGVGYRGSENVDCKSESYLRWSDMLNRCYNEKLHERQPQYKDKYVCEEWKNYSNYKVWFDSHKFGDTDIDKDILYKGNNMYSQCTCAAVPHMINTLFVNGKKNRGDLPLGVYFDTEKGKYRAIMSLFGKPVKLGTFESWEDAFVRYKEYKEDFIKDMAEQHKDEIPYRVYEAMMNWKIEITD